MATQANAYELLKNGSVFHSAVESYQAAFGGVSAMIWATLLRWMGWFPINVWWLAIAWVLAVLPFLTPMAKK